MVIGKKCGQIEVFRGMDFEHGCSPQFNSKLPVSGLKISAGQGTMFVLIDRSVLPYLIVTRHSREL